MADSPFTEPVPIPCLFASGTECEVIDGVVRIIAFVDLPRVPTKPHKRRVIARLVLPMAAARELQRELVAGLLKSRS